ncbi:MAG: Crp/Fnr family transcriptional regulator [Myxococcales bacterium]|nr:Crp/Fnr family transcriptional regulator [Myxococcales bacterium]
MTEPPPHPVHVLRLGLKHVSLGEFIRHDELLLHSALIRETSVEERDDLAHGAEVSAVAEDEVLLQEGVSAPRPALVLEGGVRLTLKDGMVDVAFLTKGDVFGLDALGLSEGTPAATGGPGGAKVAWLEVGRVRRLLSMHPETATALEQAAEKRMNRANEGSDLFDRF